MTRIIKIGLTVFLLCSLVPSWAQERIPAEAEVVAAKKPVKLAFRIYKTKIKKGEYFWHQIRLVNTGKEVLSVYNSIFSDPGGLFEASRTHWGVFVEAQDEKGRPYTPHELYRVDPDYSEDDVPVSGLLEIEGPGEQAMVGEWMKKGLSNEQVNEKLMAYKRRKMDEKALRNAPPAKNISLAPGKSVETKSWFRYSAYHRKIGLAEPQPAGDFQRLECFPFEPGKYRVRAVYQYSLADKDKKDLDAHGISTYGNLLVRTPWINIEVTP